MRVRTAEPGDAEGIAKVEVETWRATYQGMVPDQLLAELSFETRLVYISEVLAQSGHGGRCLLVAEDSAGQVVSFVSAGPSRWPDLSYTGEVYGLYVLPTAQGSGVGRALMSEAARHLRAAGIPSLMLWVLAANPYRRFYDRLGGVVVAERQIKVRGFHLDAVAYGWADVATLQPSQTTAEHLSNAYSEAEPQREVKRSV